MDVAVIRVTAEPVTTSSQFRVCCRKTEW